jgi:hypothetical protein
MPMPSLFRYFAFVGVALLGLLSLANFLLDPSTGATNVGSTSAKPVIAVQHDPRASKIERWRDEQAALKAAQEPQPGENASLVTKPAPEPDRPALASAAATAPRQPAQPVTAAAQSELATPQPAAAPATENASVVGVETAEEAAAARAAKLAERKAKLAKVKARKERLARERAAGQQVAGNGGVPVAGYYGAARERTAANQQDQYYYGQRGGAQLTTRYSSAYAPQQSYGPFSWGRGW